MNKLNEAKQTEQLVRYEELIKKLSYSNKVYGYDSDDLQQEFRMVLLSCLAKFDSKLKIKFETYFTKSCIYRVKTLRMKNRNEPLSLDNYVGDGTTFIDLIESKELTSEEMAYNQELLTDINQFLDNLPYGYITKMYIVYGISQGEIATAENMSRTYVIKIHKKNMKLLKAKFAN